MLPDFDIDPPDPNPSPTQVNTHPVCQVCGRGEDTLRYATYPFVVSLVVVTYRRSFGGLLCQRHRRLYWLLAVTITSLFGWLGIPFGFIFTPWYLIQLLAGGQQPADLNSTLLRNLADQKERNGDLPGAIKCLEASLRYSDHIPTREHLAQLYRTIPYRQTAVYHPGFLTASFALLALCGLSGFLGFLTGIANYLSAIIFSAIFPDEANIFIAILSWAPLVFAGVIAIYLARLGIERFMSANRLTSPALTTALSIFIGGSLLYGILEAAAVLGYLNLLLERLSFAPFSDFILSAGAVLLRGGLLVVQTNLADGDLSSWIYLILIAGLGGVGVYTLRAGAMRSAEWQARLADLYSPYPGETQASSLPAWAVLAVAAVVIAVLIAIIPQQGMVDFIDAAEANARGLDAYNQGDLKSAANQMERAVQIDAAYPVYHLNLAWMYLYSGRQQEAMEQFGRVKQLDPNNPDAYAGRGMIYFRTGQFDQAEAEYRSAIHLDPNHLDGQVGLGWVYLQTARLEEALQTFEAILEVYPEATGALEGLGTIYLTQKEYEKSIQALEKAVALDESLLTARATLGQVYLYKGDLDRAEKTLQKVLETDQQNIGSLFLMALTLSGKGEFEEATRFFTRLHNLDDSSSMTHSLMARVYYLQNRLPFAEKELKRARDLAAEDAQSWYSLGGVELSMHRFPEAEADLIKAVELAEDDALMKQILSDAYASQGKYDQALQICDDIIQADPKNVNAYIGRSSVFVDLEKFPEALTELEQAEKLEPNNPNINNMRSFIAFQMGSFDLSLAEAEKALRLSKYHSGAQRNLAFALHALGDFDAAEKAATQAVKLDPMDDTPHYILGMVYLEQGRPVLASAELQKFLDYYWDRPFARDYVEKARQALDTLNQ